MRDIGSASPRILVTGVGLFIPKADSPSELLRYLSQGNPDEPINVGLQGTDMLDMQKCHFFDRPTRQTLANQQVTGSRQELTASYLALMVSIRAMENAGLLGIDQQELTIGVAAGSGMGDAQNWMNARQCKASTSDYVFQNSNHIASALDLNGPVFDVGTACAASGYAIALSAMELMAGNADVMICVGAEAGNMHSLSAFNRLGALSNTACRAFDSRRDGTVFGEGAAALILEREDSFRNRGGKEALAVLSGYGMSCDAFHPTAPEEYGTQVERAIRASLAMSGLSPSDICALIPHATGTQLNDRLEAKVQQRVFGDVKHQPITVPLKSYIGHGGGTAGILSAVCAVEMLKQDMIPPRPTNFEPDTDCPVNMLTTARYGAKLNAIMLNAYAFGGNNVSLVLNRVVEGAHHYA